MSPKLPLFTPEYRGVPGHPGYRVGNDGTVWSCWKRCGRPGVPGTKGILTEAWYKLKQSPDGHGYQRVNLNGWYSSVGRLVLLAFVGDPLPGQEMLHGQKGKGDDSLPNLRWGTRVENQADRLRDGTDQRGERNHRAKLNQVMVAEIRRLRGTPQRILAEKYGVSIPSISMIQSGKRWG